MTPLVIAGLAACAAMAAYFARQRPVYASLSAVVGLAVVVAVAVMARVELPPATVVVGQVTIADGVFLRGAVVCTAAAMALVCLIGALLDPEAEVAVPACASVAGVALVFSLTDPMSAMVAGATVGFLGLIGSSRSGHGAFRQLSVVPGIALIVVLVADAAVVSPSQPSTVAVALAILLGIGICLRTAAIPFHVAPLRLARGAPLGMVPLHAVILPTALILPALAWVTGNALSGVISATGVGGVLVVLGGVTIVLAALAMFAQDDLGAVVTVHAIGDLGLVVMAFGVGGIGVGPVAVWLLVTGLARAAMVGWAMVVSERTNSRGVRGSMGWARLSPTVVPGFVVAVAAGIGWPGSIAFDARRLVLDAAVPGTGTQLLLAASLLTSLAYVRVLWRGVRRPSIELADDRITLGLRLSRWAAAAVVVGLGALPITVAAGITGLAPAAADWAPFTGR
ncbi:MAG: proton-conducting transporter membrane subunit [Candidatus Limnocylindrales bacterium]